jgi:type II secretion system protein I
MVYRLSINRRAGLTLLEVLVALAVFLMSMVGLGTLITMSSDRAIDVRQKGWAIQRCQSKMAEVLVGAVPLESQQDIPFDEDPDWRWSLEVEDSGVIGLMRVTVRVSRQRADRSAAETSLTQLVLDPSLRGGAAPPVMVETGTSDPASSGGGRSNGNSSGGR